MSKVSCRVKRPKGMARMEIEVLKALKIISCEPRSSAVQLDHTKTAQLLVDVIGVTLRSNLAAEPLVSSAQTI